MAKECAVPQPSGRDVLAGPRAASLTGRVRYAGEPGHMTTFTIEPRGAYSLRETAMFGFGGRNGSWDARMRLTFVSPQQKPAQVDGAVWGGPRPSRATARR